MSQTLESRGEGHMNMIESNSVVHTVTVYFKSIPTFLILSYSTSDLCVALAAEQRSVSSDQRAVVVQLLSKRSRIRTVGSRKVKR